MGCTVNTDLILFHGLQQCALGFRTRTVNLVSQHHFTKNRSCVKFETLLLRIVNIDAQHIRRQ